MVDHNLNLSVKVGRSQHVHVIQPSHSHPARRCSTTLLAHTCGLAPLAPTGQVLQCHIVHNLIVATLQEGGVDGAERHEALACQARRKRHGVLLRDSHVKHAVRELVLEPARRGSASACMRMQCLCSQEEVDGGVRLLASSHRGPPTQAGRQAHLPMTALPLAGLMCANWQYRGQG